MDDRAHLHDGETLLCSMHASGAGLLQDLLRGCIEGLFFGAIIGMAGAIAITAIGWSFGLVAGVVLLVLGLALVIAQRVRLWLHTCFRVTTERLLVPAPGPLFHPPLHTIKWSQYQESHVGHRKAFDIFFFSRPLVIRYGTADANKEVRFPALRYAEDLKHYLDKVDSAVRRNDTASLKSFVAKPRGKRDVDEVTGE
jgi:hypothetical protein